MPEPHYTPPLEAAIYCPGQRSATTTVTPQIGQSTGGLVVDESAVFASATGVVGFLLGILAAWLWRRIHGWRLTGFIPHTPPPRQPIAPFLPRRVATADLLEDDDERDDAFTPLGEDGETPRRRSPPCWFCGLPKDVGNHDQCS